MLENDTFSETDCFIKSSIASKGIEEIFLLSSYTDSELNLFDFLNIYSKFLVLYVDEYIACNHDYMLFAVERLFTLQGVNCNFNWLCGGYTPMFLLGTMAKLLMELSIVAVWPQKSGFVPAWNFLVMFF